MEARLIPEKVAPGGYRALLGVEEYVKECGLEASLLHLVKLRSSQINGCAWCIDMHTKDARAAGETEQRLYLLDAWREAPYYSGRERAALAWAEAVTTICTGDVTDEVFDAARAEFSEVELVNLNFAVIAINSWNRMNVPFRVPAGDYESPTPPEASGPVLAR